MTTLAETLKATTESLHQYTDTPRLDAELLICHVLDIPKTRFFTDADQILQSEQLAAIDQLVQQRIEGQPIAYLIGYRHFWDLKLKVTPDTLIPRPETELLVETALELFSANDPVDAIDLGTGTGAIALAIARERPDWHITATDQSRDALAIAMENAEAYQLDNVTLIQSHWFDNITADSQYDLIISNPPYVPADAPHLRDRGVRYEPRYALISGVDGLDDIRILIPQSKKHLKPDGWLLLEHGFDQGEQVKQLFIENDYADIRQKKDLNGHTRATFGKSP